MATDQERASALQQLTLSFVLNHPHSAAREIESLPLDEAVELVRAFGPDAGAGLWAALVPGRAVDLLEKIDADEIAPLLGQMDPHLLSRLLGRMAPEQRSEMLERLPHGLAAEARELLDYPEQSVGRIMQTRVTTLAAETTVAEAIEQLRLRRPDAVGQLFVVDKDGKVLGAVEYGQLLFAEAQRPLELVAHPLPASVGPLDPIEEVIERNEDWRVEVIPVIDVHGRLAGIINRQQFFESVKEDLVTDMQTMVGASRDERALSPSLFAVRKRLPWLQVNLLTAFLAAAVVGLFESTIAMYTALAVLLPVAAGQSGNAGAQALAVTMRGLTLREITLSQWWQVTLKEVGVGLINGAAIAITCGIGVLVWSGSVGLALVIALSMVISLVIAGMAGALVPILLKRFGQDPAQSSSIVLTTVTDIAGFMSFLGIATLLSAML